MYIHKRTLLSTDRYHIQVLAFDKKCTVQAARRGSTQYTSIQSDPLSSLLWKFSQSFGQGLARKWGNEQVDRTRCELVEKGLSAIYY